MEPARVWTSRSAPRSRGLSPTNRTARTTASTGAGRSTASRTKGAASSSSPTGVARTRAETPRDVLGEGARLAVVAGGETHHLPGRPDEGPARPAREPTAATGALRPR